MININIAKHRQILFVGYNSWTRLGMILFIIFALLCPKGLQSLLIEAMGSHPGTLLTALVSAVPEASTAQRRPHAWPRSYP